MNQISLPNQLPFGCRPFLAGGGQVAQADQGIRLTLPAATARTYADAQLDDYGNSRRFAWRPPLEMAVRARFSSGRILGTAGFGFWNNPFTPLGGLPALPRAAWFFHASAPSDMALAEGVPGRGWKAACIDATRPAALAWAPLAPLVLGLNHVPALRRRLWPRVQQALCIHEALLDLAMEEWHDYQMSWQAGGVTFVVDGKTVLQADDAPRGPMGFVAWVDNQYAIVTPRGRLGWGLLDVSAPQWMELSEWRIVQGSGR